MPYILSPEQKVVLGALLQKESSSTKYFDPISAMQTICKACIEILGENKKILIHIPDATLRSAWNNMLEATGLDDLSIELSDRNFMPEVDAIKLRSTLKKQKNTDAMINYVLSSKKEAVLKSGIDEFYNALDSKVMADTPFRDFVTNAIYQKKSINVQLQIDYNSKDQLKLSASEYYGVKKEINKAASLYHRQYDLYDHLALFREELWSDITADKIVEIKSLLHKFKMESTALVNDFKATSLALLKASTKELDETFKSLQKAFQSHEENCIAFNIKSTNTSESKEGMFSIFSKKKKQASNKIFVDAFDDLSSIIQTLSQEWYDELPAPTSEMITYQYILEFINTNKEKASFYKNKLKKNLQNSVQRINKINTSTEAVKNLDQSLKSFIQKLNDSKLFDLNLEHNILSFVKQVELCKNIDDYIERCTILVSSSSSYLEWKSFYNSSSNVFRSIFAQLKKWKKNEWTSAFEQWYEHQILLHVLDQKTISAEALGKYFVQANATLQSEVASLTAHLHTQRVEGANRLKESAKELHHTLFKKKQMPQVSWNNTALMNRPFMQSFFPMHISDSLAYDKEYDFVLSFSKDAEDKKDNVHYFSPIEPKDIQNIAEKKNYFLYLNDYNYTRPLAQLSSTDKLKAAKKLAKFILSLNQNIKIYQLKNANIISLLPGHDDSYLELELDKMNAKVIDTSGVLYDRLTESILFTERRPFLIIKDELINSELHEHLLWQLKMIDLFRQVGYEIVSLNTTDQLQNNKDQFLGIVQKIGGSDTKMDQEVEKTLNSESPISEKV